MSITMFVPIFKYLIKHLPTLFHCILTGKESRIACNTVFYKAYICISCIIPTLFVAEFHLHITQKETRSQALHCYALYYTFIWLYTQNQFLTRSMLISELEHLYWRRFKVYKYLCDFSRHILSCTNKEWHTFPPPVVDI